MKKYFLLLLISLSAGIGSFAQCDKKIVLTASTTVYLDGQNVEQRSVDELTTVEYNSKEITVMPGDKTMQGAINSISCDWKIPFKEGKTIIKTTLTNPNGQSVNMTITIEGKDGKVTLLGEFDESPDRKVKLTLDKFEEKK